MQKSPASKKKFFNDVKSSRSDHLSGTPSVKSFEKSRIGALRNAFQASNGIENGEKLGFGQHYQPTPKLDYDKDETGGGSSGA